MWCFYFFLCLFVTSATMRVQHLCTMYTGLRICWLHPLQRVKTQHEKRGCPGYDAKVHLMVRLQFWRSREYGITPSLSLLLGSLWLRVVLAVMVPSRDQIDLFENYLYNLRNDYKKSKYEHGSLTSRYKIILDRLTCH